MSVIRTGNISLKARTVRGVGSGTGDRSCATITVESFAEGDRVDVTRPDHEFFAGHQGERELETVSGVVRESKGLNGDRLRVQLDYPDGAHEEFEWQLFTPAKMISLAQSVGLGLMLSCTDFDTAITPSPAKPRIQFVLERSRERMNATSQWRGDAARKSIRSRELW